MLKRYYPSSYSTLSLFLVLCLAHFINLVVNERMKNIHFCMDELRTVINVLRVSTKRSVNIDPEGRELFACSYMPEAVHMPFYDTETRWSPTF